MVAYDDLAARTDLNQSLQTSADADQPDWRSKSEGSACTDHQYCISGVCVGKLGSDPPTKVCALDDYKQYARSSFLGMSPFMSDYYHAVAESAFFRPMWASLCVAAAGLVPVKHDRLYASFLCVLHTDRAVSSRWTGADDSLTTRPSSRLSAQERCYSARGRGSRGRPSQPAGWEAVLASRPTRCAAST